jgi:opacity protein-like surface antigen
MKTLLLFLASTSALLAQGPPPIAGNSRLQMGAGVLMAKNEDLGAEAGFGIAGELGLLYDHNPIDMVWGVRAAYIADVGDNNLDTDILDFSLFGRVLFPIGSDAIKFYGEGRLGLGNLQVSGSERAGTTVGGRRFSIRNNIDSQDWTFGWGLGFGVQLDFTNYVGLRVGYELQSYGDLEALGFRMDPGFVHGGTASLVFKF